MKKLCQLLPWLPDAEITTRQVMAKDKLVYRFCHIYRFTRASGATINSLTTFMIKELN